jgi:NADPH2:quinone reductase
VRDPGRRGPRGWVALRHLDDVARSDLQVVIDRRFPLEQAVEAHAYIESRQAFGRVLLIP